MIIASINLSIKMSFSHKIFCQVLIKVTFSNKIKKNSVYTQPLNIIVLSQKWRGMSWSWSYGNWIYNHLCNHWLSPLKLWIRIPLMVSVLDTTLCDIVCQWHKAGQRFSLCTPVSFTNKTDSHDITEILLKVAFNTITLILIQKWNIQK